MTNIDENLKFLILEVKQQLEDVSVLLRKSSQPDQRISKIFSRDDYINILQNFILKECFRSSSRRSKKRDEFYKAVDVISRNLEHMGDYTVSIIKKTRFISEPEFLKRFSFKIFFKELTGGIQLIEDALFNADIQRGYQICQTEQRVHGLYKKEFSKILEKMKQGEEIENNVSLLFILGYLERMGDAILNIGEAIISLVLGDKVKIYQYNSFRELTSTVFNTHLNENDVAFQPMGQTRSGCQINRVEGHLNGKVKTEVIFKDGVKKKIIQEKENLVRWNKIVPHLVPRVFGVNETKKKASILLEFIRGRNFRDILLEGSDSEYHTVLNALMQTVEKVWDLTKVPQGECANCIRQLQIRMEDIYKIHPDFRLGQYNLGLLQEMSLEEKLTVAEGIEKKLKPPFFIFIHGDFNIDNIIFNSHTKRLYYLDVYRSKEMDYIQDVSVFIVSNFRLPIFDASVRDRLNRSSVRILNFCKAYAHRYRDETFEARLAFGLIRSFMTSTRFVLDKDFAKVLFHRGVYLLNKILSHEGRPWKDFSLKEDVLIY